MEKLTTKLNLITIKIIIFFSRQQHYNTCEESRRWIYFPHRSKKIKKLRKNNLKN
jgi:hypothetical protein